MCRKILKLNTYMKICRDLSALSHDTKYAVAAIAITDNFSEICGIGYNGDYSGGPNVRTNFDHGKSGFIHSEANLLTHIGRPYEMRQNLIIMCTHKPCTMCAKLIVNSGIKRVVYDEDYVDEEGYADEVFSSSCVSCVKLSNLTSSDKRVKDFLSSKHSYRSS
jgi:dCMP deaminase